MPEKIIKLFLNLEHFFLNTEKTHLNILNSQTELFFQHKQNDWTATHESTRQINIFF